MAAAGSTTEPESDAPQHSLSQEPEDIPHEAPVRARSVVAWLGC